MGHIGAIFEVFFVNSCSWGRPQGTAEMTGITAKEVEMNICLNLVSIQRTTL